MCGCQMRYGFAWVMVLVAIPGRDRDLAYLRCAEPTIRRAARWGTLFMFVPAHYARDVNTCNTNCIAPAGRLDQQHSPACPGSPKVRAKP